MDRENIINIEFNQNEKEINEIINNKKLKNRNIKLSININKIYKTLKDLSWSK